MTDMETSLAGYREGKGFGDRHLTKAKENERSIRTTEVGEDSTHTQKWSLEGSDKRLRLERREEREEAPTKHRTPV